MVNGNVITNKNCIAETFNDFFVNAGSNFVMLVRLKYRKEKDVLKHF